MTDLTVLILTKDEEMNLPKCIASIGGLAKRIVVVDSGSTDGTEAAAKAASRRDRPVDFYFHKWPGFSKQLNWGFENTKIDTEWIMRMDADEELTPELREEIDRRLPLLTSDINGVILRRRVYFMGRWLKHGGKYPELLLRIFRRGKGHCEERRMDEHLVVTEGKVVTFNSDFSDKNNKDLTWWTQKHNGYSSLEAQDYLSHTETGDAARLNANARRKRKLKYGGYYRLPSFFRAHLYFIYRYYLRLGFLDGVEGKIYTFLQAYWYRFLVDAKLEEYRHKEQEK